PSRSTKPILENVKLEATASGTILTATDMEIGIRVSVDEVDVQKSGEVILPTARFGAILRESHDDTLCLALTKQGLHAEIKGDRSLYKLNTEDPAEYPIVKGFDL